MEERFQQTLERSVSYEGMGLFTGAFSRITLFPAEPNTGIDFVRVDLSRPVTIPVSLDHFGCKFRRTVLSRDQAEIETTEHLIAAFSGLGIDNVRIEVSGGEIPVADGSSKVFCDLIRQAGIRKQKETREVLILEEPVYFHNGNTTLIALPSQNGLIISYTLEFSHTRPPLCQHLTLSITPETFQKEVAPARTFCFKSEVEQFLSKGLGKGANPENTIILEEQNWMSNTQDLRYPNELVRHKILDLVGDLKVLGRDLCAHIIAIRSGHQTNLQFVKTLFEKTRASKRGQKKFDISHVLSVLPHRYPFLLIDRVLTMDGFDRAVGLKNVSVNDPFFQGHFPGRPIMPGVLQVEAMAQLAGVLLLRSQENQSKLPVLLAIDQVKLRKIVEPGDQLLIEVETVKLKSRYGIVRGRCTVEGKPVAEAIIKFMFINSGSSLPPSETPAGLPLYGAVSHPL